MFATMRYTNPQFTLLGALITILSSVESTQFLIMMMSLWHKVFTGRNYGFQYQEFGH